MRKFICLLIITTFFLSLNSKAFTVNFRTSYSILDSTPTATGTVNRDTVCYGDTVLITINFTGTGPWLATGTETVNGGTPVVFTDTIPDSVYTFPAIPDAGTTVYNIIDILDLGTGDTNTGNVGGGAPVSIFTNSLPTATGMISPNIICIGDTVNVEMNFTGAGPWLVTGTDSVNGGQLHSYTQTISTPLFQFQSIPDVGTNFYNVIYIKDMTTGCVNSGNIGGGAPVTVNAYAPPTASGIISPDPVCFGNTVDLQLNLTGIGPWIITGTDSVSGGQRHSYIDTISSSVFQFQAIPDVGINYYNVIFIKDMTTGCVNQGNIGGGNALTAVAHPIPDIHVNGLIPVDSVCQGDMISLGVHFLSAGSPYMIKIKELADDTTSTLIPRDTTFILNMVDTGRFSFSFLYITNNYGCSKELNYASDISVFRIPQATLANFSSVCDTIEMVALTEGTPVGGIYSGRGVYGDYFYPSNAGGPGTYQITYTLKNGPCTDSKTKGIIVNLCSDLSVSENNGPEFNIYPNPSEGMTNIHFSNLIGNASLQIINPNGQVVFSDHINTSSTEKSIDLSHLSAGIYFIKLMNDKGIRTEKLIVK